jgi:hypothetical protein
MMHYDYELVRARMDERLREAQARRLARSVRDGSLAVRSWASLVRWVSHSTAAGRRPREMVESSDGGCHAPPQVGARPAGDDVRPPGRGGEGCDLAVVADSLEVSLADANLCQKSCGGA